VAANAADTMARAAERSAATPVLAASTVANMSSAMAKDRAFARMYGASAPRPAPFGMFGSLLVRDLLSMAFFFTIPPLLSAELQQGGVGAAAADASAQFVTPVLAQYVTTPWHLLGLNMYNAPSATPSQRWASVRGLLPSSVVARQLRVIPPFALGGIANRSMRAHARAALDAGGA